MFFIGIDLAWSDRNKSGLALIQGDELGAHLVSSELVGKDEEVVRRIVELAGDEALLVAIDAPLIVPNRSGRRRAEELVGMLFGQYDAGAHPANRTRLKQACGRVRGEDLVKLLGEVDILHEPRLKMFERTRKCFEVYPHPAMVAIFHLPQILKYKARPQRSYEERYEAFRRYQRLLRKLPDLKLPKAILARKVEGLKGEALKEYEDLLDATFCAYIAYYCWKDPQRCAVLGNLREGYILTPTVQDRQDPLLARKNS